MFLIKTTLKILVLETIYHFPLNHSHKLSLHNKLFSSQSEGEKNKNKKPLHFGQQIYLQYNKLQVSCFRYLQM